MEKIKNCKLYWKYYSIVCLYFAYFHIMSNRILWFLVIIACGLFWYVYISFFQVELVPLNSAKTQSWIQLEVLPSLESLWKIQEMALVDKISYLKRKNNSYAIFVFDDGREFYFIEKDGKLELFRGDETRVWSFDKIRADKIELLPVYGDSKHIIIKLWEQQFLLNVASFKMTEINMTIPIKYAKAWWNSFEFLLVTDKWTFEYKSFDGLLDYFSYFKDFVYLDNFYIWVIDSDESVKLKNLWFDDETQNLIVSYNPSTKERKIIFRTDMKLDKIIKEGNEVILINEEWEQYKLQDF